MSAAFTLKGARVVDPASGTDAVANVVIADGVVRAVGRATDGTTIDADGLICAPGLVDLHVHLREPGGEDAEKVSTGTAAAAAGGFTAVCPMANTNPVMDHAGVVEQVLRLAREAGHCDVFPVGAITKGLEGEELAEMGAMAAIGVRCFSDDGRPVASAQVMRRALTYARSWDAVICNHAEEPTLTHGAQMHEGDVSARLGLAGWPREAEEIQVARDLILARDLGARVHVPHLSTAEAVALVRQAKSQGGRVTAEATPHHFTLDHTVAGTYDPVYKVNPPLRTEADVAAIRAGLADGTIDAIATDHAPHTAESKEAEWAYAPCGMVGLETALGVTLTELVDANAAPSERGDRSLSLVEALRCLTTNPARSRDIAGHGGPIAAGQPANLVLFDPQAVWAVEPAAFLTRSRNTPFEGRKLRGRVVHTILRGAFTFRDGELAG